MRHAPIALAVLSAALLSLAAVTSANAAPTYTMDINLASVHTEQWARHDLNQRNEGLGFSAHFNRNWSVSTGWYRNSYRRGSAYLLANWTPLHFALPADWRIAAGGTAGLDSGYRTNEVASQPFMAAGLVRVIAPQGWSVNLMAVPNGSGRRSGFIGAQMSVPL